MKENVARARDQLGLSPVEEEQETKDADDQPSERSVPGTAPKPKPVVKVTDKREPPKAKSTPRPPPVQDGIAADEPDTAIRIRDMPLAERLPKTRPAAPGISAYFMNNREKFINFINSVFSEEKGDLIKEEEQISCLDISSDRPFSLLTHQKIVRDYLNLYTPYRGLLLYHGLGSGKTCSSIAIAEGLKVKNNVIVMTPASLQKNYLEEIKKCGDELYRTRHFWEFIETKGDHRLETTLSGVLRLPMSYIREQGGVWMVDANKPSNTADLSSTESTSLGRQINQMIEEKYEFISYNGLTRARMERLTEGYTANPFDNKVVVIDEAHNLVSRIVGKLKKEDSISYKLYEYLLSAKNCRVVLLTGTPMINYPNEIGVLFNILRGYITTWKFNLDTSNQRVLGRRELEQMFSEEEGLRDIVDFVDYNSSSKVITVTRNPIGFVNATDGGVYEGVFAPGEIRDQLDDNQFVRLITSVLSKNRIAVVPGDSGTHVVKFKALPDTREEFTNMFIDESTGEMKNMDKFKRRILGLASYFPDIQKLMPRYSGDMCVVEVTMSDYQFGMYETARDRERKLEKKSKKPKKKGAGEDIFDDSASTYKIFSRAFCNFVFPEAVPRPMLQKGSDVAQEDDAALSAVNPEEDRDRLVNEIEELQKDASSAQDDDAATLQERIRDVEAALSELDRDIATDDAIVQVDATLQAKETDLADGPSPDTAGAARDEAQLYRKAIDAALKELQADAAKYFSKDALRKYSPKFLQILENVQDPALAGLHLLYSQFRTVEGIEIFARVLEYNGFAQFKIVQNPSRAWHLAVAPEDMDKPKFVLYTGTEGKDEKEIIRNVFNSNWDMVPSELRQEVMDMPDVVFPTRRRLTANKCANNPKKKATKRLKMKGGKGGKGTRKKNKPSAAAMPGGVVSGAAADEPGAAADEPGASADEPSAEKPGAEKPSAEKPSAEKPSASLSAAARAPKQTNNHMGEIIKLFMITASGAEGISLKSVRYVHLTEPYWNPIRLEQVIGRARRICSHEFLPDELNDVEVFLYMMIFSKHQLDNLASQELKLKDKGKIDMHTPITTDQALFEIANIKHDIARQLFRSIKEASIDCLLHARSGSGSDDLKCYTFSADPSSSAFSYQPSLFSEESDQVRKANKTTVTWRAQELTIRGKKYAMNPALQGADTGAPYNDVYDFASYQLHTSTKDASDPPPCGQADAAAGG